jgi:hypothetical protein
LKGFRSTIGWRRWGKEIAAKRIEGNYVLTKVGEKGRKYEKRKYKEKNEE